MYSVYMSVKGEKTGQFEGSSGNKGHEKQIEILGYQHELKAPIDTNSLRSAGRTQLGLVRIRKPIDASTPLFYQASFLHEILTEVKIEFFTSGTTGVGTKYLEVILKDALVAKTEVLFWPELGNRSDPFQLNTQTVEFAYQKINWSASSFDLKGGKIVGPKTVDIDVKEL
jgi:type VI secretion system secreted protein Hcp